MVLNTLHTKTERGFNIIEFHDRYNKACSIQKSSLAIEDAIWFGITNPEPKIMASHAYNLGIKTDVAYGWIDYPIPKEVNISTRMHLTRNQVEELLPVLQKFVETGEIE